MKTNPPVSVFRPWSLSLVVLLLWLTGCGATLAIAPTATPWPTATPPPTPTPERATVVREIETTWQEVDSLARTHLLEAELECEACHPAGVMAAGRPPNELCLDCHDTSISELYRLTNENGVQVPPAAHMETELCSTSHRGHTHIADPCSGCH